MWQRVRSYRLIAAFLIFSAACGVAQTAASAKPKSHRFLMWKVTSPTATVYLVGSMHLIGKDAYPLPKAVEDAFASANVLVVELDAKHVDKTNMIALIQRYGAYTGEDKLSAHISKPTSDALDAFCAEYAVPRAALETMKPWVVDTLVSMLPLQKAGADPEGGIDMHFLGQVQPPKRIDELETLEYQTELLASGSEKEQDEALAYSLAHGHDILEADKEDVAGDPEAIVKRLAQAQPQTMMKRLLEDRNPRMIQKIGGYLKGKETVFVVVGMAHVIGEKGIAKALEANYKVERMTLEW